MIRRCVGCGHLVHIDLAEDEVPLDGVLTPYCPVCGAKREAVSIWEPPVVIAANAVLPPIHLMTKERDQPLYPSEEEVL